MNEAREQLLAETFVELADTLVEDFDVIEFLGTLAARCVELLGVGAAGVALGDQHGRLRSAAASAEEARLLELFEVQTDVGPCVDAFRTGQPVVNADLVAEEERWPRFATAAREAGFTSVHALPMRLRGEVIGALNLFCVEATTLTESEQRIGQAMTDAATISILQNRGARHAETVTEQLQTALNSRTTIEQAKGVLAERGNLTMGEAFDALRSHARRTNQRLSDLARGVCENTVDTSQILPDASEPTR